MKNIKSYSKFFESSVSIRDMVLGATDWTDWLDAVRVEYGETVPLFHATTEEAAAEVDRVGFRLSEGGDRTSFGGGSTLYFQLGKSSYFAPNRPVLFRVDVPVSFLMHAQIDMDSVGATEEEARRHVQYFDELDTDVRDAIQYFVGNGMSLDGTELVFRDSAFDEPDSAFEGILPVRIQ